MSDLRAAKRARKSTANDNSRDIPLTNASSQTSTTANKQLQGKSRSGDTFKKPRKPSRPVPSIHNFDTSLDADPQAQLPTLRTYPNDENPRYRRSTYYNPFIFSSDTTILDDDHVQALEGTLGINDSTTIDPRLLAPVRYNNIDSFLAAYPPVENPDLADLDNGQSFNEFFDFAGASLESNDGGSVKDMEASTASTSYTDLDDTLLRPPSIHPPSFEEYSHVNGTPPMVDTQSTLDHSLNSLETHHQPVAYASAINYPEAIQPGIYLDPDLVQRYTWAFRQPKMPFFGQESNVFNDSDSAYATDPTTFPQYQELDDGNASYDWHFELPDSTTSMAYTIDRTGIPPLPPRSTTAAPHLSPAFTYAPRLSPSTPPAPQTSSNIRQPLKRSLPVYRDPDSMSPQATKKQRGGRGVPIGKTSMPKPVGQENEIPSPIATPIYTPRSILQPKTWKPLQLKAIEPLAPISTKTDIKRDDSASPTYTFMALVTGSNTSPVHSSQSTISAPHSDTESGNEVNPPEPKSVSYVRNRAAAVFDVPTAPGHDPKFKKTDWKTRCGVPKNLPEKKRQDIVHNIKARCRLLIWENLKINLDKSWGEFPEEEKDKMTDLVLDEFRQYGWHWILARDIIANMCSNTKQNLRRPSNKKRKAEEEAQA